MMIAAGAHGSTPVPVSLNPLVRGQEVVRVDIPRGFDEYLETGKIIGSSNGYSSIEDASSALGELTNARGSAIVYMDGERFVGRQLGFVEEETKGGVGFDHADVVSSKWVTYDLGDYDERGVRFLSKDALAIVDGPHVVTNPNSASIA